MTTEEFDTLYALLRKATIPQLFMVGRLLYIIIKKALDDAGL